MNSSLNDRIISLFKKGGHKPLKTKEILKKLGFGRDQKHEVKNIITKMCHNGTVQKLKGGRYRLRNIQERSMKNNDLPKKAKIIGKITKKSNKYYFSPRDEKLPTVQIKNTRNLKIQNGTLAVIKVDSKSRQPVLDKVLGKAGEIGAEKKAIIHSFNVPEKFPRGVLKESENILHKIPQSVIKKRADLRKQLVFTIDNDDARDFDDAVGIRKTKNGYKLWVSIADVSYYVKEGSSLDKEARKRANSIYLPDRVYPMLPEVLSNNLCSLVPNEDRLTKTAEIDFDTNGKITGYKLYNSIINSSARLTYTKVKAMLNKNTPVPKGSKKILSSLKMMHQLYKKLKKIRIKNGELEFDFPEPELIRDRSGDVLDIKKGERNIAHGIIEEFMIAANNVAAEYTMKRKVHSLYRIHEQPEMASIYELRDSLDELGYKMNLNGKITPGDIQKVMIDARDKNDRSAVYMLILKSLKKAEYSTREIGHFGLALDIYTHFTSPIRRYPDLVVHRILNALFDDGNNWPGKPELDNIAAHCSISERNSDEIERESIDLERAVYMKKNVGKTYEGRVISVMPFGMFVELDSVFVEGFIHRSEMKVGRKRKWFLIGEKVKVKVTESDIEKRRVRLSLVI